MNKERTKWPKIVAIDFDGCLCDSTWPDLGPAIEENIKAAIQEQKNGSRLILWTCRVGEKLKVAVDWCKERGLIFDAHNENLDFVIEYWGCDSRKIFANEYWDDKGITKGKESPKSYMVEWAENEISLAAGNMKAEELATEDSAYVLACYDSALRSFSSVCTDRHSGFGFGMTKGILTRLLDNLPLTPIEDTPDIWSECDITGRDFTTYQCERLSSLFKYVHTDGRVEYRDNDRYIATDVDSNAQYRSRLVGRIVEELFPITMPYYPTQPIKVICERFSTDVRKDDFDTLCIVEATLPDGRVEGIQRYYKKGDTGWAQIPLFEYLHRKHRRIVNRLAPIFLGLEKDK